VFLFVRKYTAKTIRLKKAGRPLQKKKRLLAFLLSDDQP
jgi:hypothetical protein